MTVHNRFLMVKVSQFILVMLVVVACNTKKSADVSDSTQIKVDSIPSIADADSLYEQFADIKNYEVSEDGLPPESIQIINPPCAIIINPSDEQIEEMRKDEDFYTIADDASFYQSNAMLVLDSFNIKSVFAEKRFLKVISEGKPMVIDIRKRGAPEWNIIFFQERKMPKVMSSIDVNNRAIVTYFEPHAN